MAVTMYNAVREFMSSWYPKKGKKGIGNKNRSHNPPIKRRNFHLSLSFVYNMLIIQFYLDLLRDIELQKKKNYVLVTVRVYFNYGLWYSLL